MDDIDVYNDMFGGDCDSYYSDYTGDMDSDYGYDDRLDYNHEDARDYYEDNEGIDLGSEYTEEMRKLQTIMKDRDLKKDTHMFYNGKWIYPEDLNDEQKNQLDCITHSLNLPESGYNVFELMDLFIGCRFEKFSTSIYYLIYFPQYNGDEDKKLNCHFKINIDEVYRFRPIEAKSAHKRK